jgi:hypothetical protein
MTLTIDGFVVTGTPEEIDTFIKLYQTKSQPITNIPPYIIQPLYQTVDPVPNDWTITCSDENKEYKFNF